ncbi:protein FAR1-RELATED SEQUENCE 5 [Brachypodium distachyon]|uniref:protein FAR1-RELATED SEQUENCE 5 n=1 Tax=Brachypodium distachyon TaxID=15368 RepID=UPI000D0E232A|nr:protein FAR1-RELATED SEQUENCE 5 [Brachypodium distachyon]|eukprot:XP_010236575.2 protein FAR1-RELATED SEQUENCE 5 [Brachypodium distachyon]
MARLYGYLDNLGYTLKDVANYRASIRMEHKYTNMEDTMDYFRKLQQQDKDFYYKYKLDEEFRVQNIFWVDGAARRVYKHYNDCVSFNTTYMTNIYKMPTFLKAMDGLAPINIITDQDFAMRAGIDEVFPNTRHRNCRWHIMKKATKKLGSYLAGRKELHAEFNDLVNSSMTPDEFEEKWNTMVQKHSLEEHEDLISLYHKRSCWVPAYFMQSFYPFLQSTARSEGFNAVLKKYVNPQNSISDFIEQYAALQEKIMRAVSKQEADMAITTAPTWSWHPIEVHMSKVYTRNIYNRFQAEMQQVMSYHCSQLNNNSFMLVCITRFVPDHGNRSYRVTADVGEAKYSCECCKFERDGMLCCHIVKVMLQMNVLEMPDAYIFKRWTWDAEEALIDESAQGGTGRTEMPEESRRKMKYT